MKTSTIDLLFMFAFLGLAAFNAYCASLGVWGLKYVSMAVAFAMCYQAGVAFRRYQRSRDEGR